MPSNALRMPRGPGLVPMLAGVVWLAFATPVHGQFIRQQVGGVSIDARGIVTNVRLDELHELRRARQQALEAVAGDLKVAGLRKVSLRGLEEALAAERRDARPLADDVRYLAGLQRVQYVFVYPEQHDIVLAGPAEAWRLNAQAEVVGVSTNRPVLLLDDLLVALRAIEGTRRSGITCSIDPTAEGLARLQALLKKVHAVGTDPSPLMAAIEESLGPQAISVSGVPDTSHFARVLVAADYRMKRLAMAFEESPVAGLPNFMQMLQSAGKTPKSMLPRWWLEPNYDALRVDADGLAWELPAAGVKALAEEEVATPTGEKQRAAHVNPLAKKWADHMTAHYDELSAKEAIFGQLRNCIDMAVVAALVSEQRLAEKSGWSLGLLVNPDLPVESYHAPKQVASQASVAQKGTNWIISASGGVSIQPWPMLDHPAAKPELAKFRAQSSPQTPSPRATWWWN